MFRDSAKDITERSDGKILVRGDGNSLMARSFRFEKDVAADLMSYAVIPMAAEPGHQILAA